MLANDSQYCVGSSWVQNFFTCSGLGWVSQLMGWVGSGHTKWTHGQLCNSQLESLGIVEICIACDWNVVTTVDRRVSRLSSPWNRRTQVTSIQSKCSTLESKNTHTEVTRNMDGGATTSAIHCWTPSIRCARPQGLELLAGRPPRTAGL